MAETLGGWLGRWVAARPKPVGPEHLRRWVRLCHVNSPEKTWTALVLSIRPTPPERPLVVVLEENGLVRHPPADSLLVLEVL